MELLEIWNYQNLKYVITCFYISLIYKIIQPRGCARNPALVNRLVVTEVNRMLECKINVSNEVSVRN